MNNFIIISFYTLNTPYQQVVHDYLMNSLSNFPQIKSDVRGVVNLGSWGANTSYKPEFILSMLAKHIENVVCVDADAEILEYPSLFENIPEEFNIACHILNKDSWYGKNFPEGYKKELLDGTFFVRNCERGKEIIKKWAQICSGTIQWPQKLLPKLLEEMGEKVFELPLSYCYISSLPNGLEPIMKCDKPVIRHNQVSRQLKRQIK